MRSHTRSDLFLSGKRGELDNSGELSAFVLFQAGKRLHWSFSVYKIHQNIVFGLYKNDTNLSGGNTINVLIWISEFPVSCRQRPILRFICNFSLVQWPKDALGQHPFSKKQNGA